MLAQYVKLGGKYAWEGKGKKDMVLSMRNDDIRLFMPVHLARARHLRFLGTIFLIKVCVAVTVSNVIVLISPLRLPSSNSSDG